MEYTGERMIPEINKGWLTYSDHYARYLAIQDVVRDKKVLDIACGTGYGTKMIAQNASYAMGVDIDQKTIDYCKQYFNAQNIDYKVGSTDDIPSKEGFFDIVVSFETIEHLPDHRTFYKEVKRVLHPNGLFICSMPNAKNPLHGTNEFHLSEQTLDKFEKELKKYFKHVEISLQNIWITSQIWPRKSYDVAEKAQKLEALTYKPFSPEPDKALVFLAIASDKPTTGSLPFTAVPSSENILEMILTLKEYKELDERLNNRIAAMEEHIKNLEARASAKK